MTDGIARASSIEGRRGRAGIPAATAVLVALGVASLCAHDLFFRAPRYHLRPNADALVDVLSGTFSKSENAITRDRLADLSLVTPGGRLAIDRDRWSDQDPKSTVRVSTTTPGTYVLGAAIHPRMLSLAGKEFNAYLKEEGIDDILSKRAAQGRLQEASRERYSKYLKAMLQVGDAPGDAYATLLGYAAEIVLEQNPYALRPGDTVTVRCIVDGRPWAGKAIFAGGRRGSTETRFEPQRLVTDEQGRATVRITGAGIWYVKFVAMTEVTDAEADYESKWSTISFGIGTAAPRPSK
jgi:uncharacterized GH25 family protein